MRAVRAGDRKLVMDMSRAPLFDLRGDIGERVEEPSSCRDQPSPVRVIRGRSLPFFRGEAVDAAQLTSNTRAPSQ